MCRADGTVHAGSCARIAVVSRNIAQDGETTYTAAVTPRVTSVPTITSRHIPLDGVCRYVDTTADQTVTGEVPPTR